MIRSGQAPMQTPQRRHLVGWGKGLNSSSSLMAPNGHSTVQRLHWVQRFISISGYVRSPALGCTVGNIGPRQNGRLRADNVIDVDYEPDAILDATRKALYDEDFRKRCRECKNPYGAGNAGGKISEILATTDINLKLLQKKITY